MKIDRENTALFEIDTAGNYILDAQSKAALLAALHRGALTDGELDLLLYKSDKYLRIVNTHHSNKQDWLRCDRGRAALEANCVGCGMRERCVYWREHRYLIEED